MLHLYNHLQEKILDTNFTLYDVRLAELKEYLAIKMYASETIQLYVNGFQAHTPIHINMSQISGNFYYGLPLLLVVAFLLVAYLLEILVTL